MFSKIRRAFALTTATVAVAACLTGTAGATDVPFLNGYTIFGGHGPLAAITGVTAYNNTGSDPANSVCANALDTNMQLVGQGECTNTWITHPFCGCANRYGDAYPEFYSANMQAWESY